MKTWTEASVLSRIRSVLRRFSMQVPAIPEAKRACRRPYTGENKRVKWEYQCAACKNWFFDKQTQVDHIVPAGKLRSFDDLSAFAKRLLFVTPDQLQVLCLPCHQTKSTEERRSAREQPAE